MVPSLGATNSVLSSLGMGGDGAVGSRHKTIRTNGNGARVHTCQSSVLGNKRRASSSSCRHRTTRTSPLSSHIYPSYPCLLSLLLPLPCPILPTYLLWGA